MLQRPSEQFKTDMPQIPGVSAQAGHPQPGFKPVGRIGFVAGLVFCLLCVRWLMRPKAPEAPRAAAPPQIEVPAPVPDASAALPHATESQPGIASVEEMAKPWTAKEFLYRNRLSGENVPAVLIRLHTGSRSNRGSYVALSLMARVVMCRLEYVTDLEKLRTDYGF